ncbi:MAG: enoyl-CoA hydratase-related protein [Candidatus Limnocylindria bacterium]
MAGSVRLETDERGVAWLTIARPEAKNAFDARLVAELTARLGELDPAARCVVIGSEGDTFCAGADVGWMRAMADYTLEENLADSRALAAMFARLDELPMPLLARVQGAAIGGGAGLVAVADLAVASLDAVFAFSEVRLGILPAVISPYVVRKCGPAFATAAFVTGVRFDARRAHQAGLVESLAAPGELDERLDHFIQTILAGGPRAVIAAKRLVRDVQGRRPDEVRDLTVERIADIRASDEGQEGLRAFLEKRAPRWS